MIPKMKRPCGYTPQGLVLCFLVLEDRVIHEVIQHHDQQQYSTVNQGDVIAGDLREAVDAGFQQAQQDDGQQYAGNLAAAALGINAAQNDDQDALQGINRVQRRCRRVHRS